MAQRATREFCRSACRKAFQNRVALRGVDLFHLFMSMILFMFASSITTYRSWDDVAKVRARNPHLGATVVGLNVAGKRRAVLVREAKP